MLAEDMAAAEDGQGAGVGEGSSGSGEALTGEQMMHLFFGGDLQQVRTSWASNSFARLSIPSHAFVRVRSRSHAFSPLDLWA